MAFLAVVGSSNLNAQNCDQAQPGPGFPSDATCQAVVCAVDGFCCTTQWDQFCADLAASLSGDACSGCVTGAGGGGGNCDDPQAGPGFPSDPTCEAAVCAIDPFCCSTQWDQFCADAAASLSGGACSGCVTGAGGGGGNCDEASGTPGFPADPTCEAAVCNLDPFCCNTAWDQACADAAAALSGGACAGCVAGGGGGCNDNVITLEMIDSWGDGWNGAVFSVIDPATSTVIDSATLPDGLFGTATFCLPDGCYDYDITGGQFSFEVSWNLLGADGGTISGLAPESGSFSINDGSCTVFGCTDPTALNYDPAANSDNGTCVVPDCPDNPITFTYCYQNNELGTSFYFEPGTPAGQVALLFNQGSIESAAWDVITIYDGDNTGAPVLYTNPVGVTTNLAGLILGSSNGNGILITITSDGSVSCGSGAFLPWDISVYCGQAQIPGCTDPLAPNFNPDATVDDGSCEPPCLDNIVTINLFDSFGDGWNGAIYTITDLITATTVASGTLPGGSFGSDSFCLTDGCYNINVTGGTFPVEVSWEIIGADGVVAGGAPNNVDFSVNTPNCDIFGCTDITATNYDPSALVDNGSCVFCGSDLLLEIGMTDASGNGWGGATYNIVNIDNGTTVATGSLNNADIGNPFTGGTDLVCIPQGCYLFSVTGGTNPGAIGWNITDQIGGFYGSANGNVANFPISIPLGNPACSFSGCTNPVALNYVPSATTDDGSCILPPANNTCANAEALFCGAAVSGTTINATDSEGLIGSTCAGDLVSSPGVWYEFNAASEQFVTASTCGGVGGDTKIHVYTGDCNNLVCVASNDDGCGAFSLLSSISWNAQTGNNYFIYVSEFGAGSGINFELSLNCVTCDVIPTNNDCDDALPQLNGVPVVASTCCSAPSGAPNFIAGAFGTAYDQWFSFNSSDYDTFFFELNNIDGEVVGLLIYDADCASLIQVAGCIVAGSCQGSIQDFLTLAPNTDYYFAVFVLDPDDCGEFEFITTGVYLGCTDVAATNYDPNATQDNGSCDYTGVTPPNDDCEGAIVLNCNDAIVGSTGGATGAGGCPPAAVTPTCGVVPPGTVDTSLQCYATVVTNDPFCCNTVWDGFCTSAYDACVAACAGFAEVWYTIEGNGDIFTITTCGSVIAADLNISTSTDGCVGSFTSVDVLPETVPCDFFNADDASISFISEVGVTYYVVVGSVQEGSFNVNVDCEPLVLGCTNPAAYNFDATANVDDGLCDFFSESCAGGPGVPVLFNMWDSFGDGWNGATYTITDGLDQVVASGDIDAADFSVDEDNFQGAEFGFDLLCLQEGCYTVTVGGGDWDGELAWNIVDEFGNVLAGAGSPAFGGGAGTFDLLVGNPVCGCTNTGACNYDPTATSEDGSCEFDSCAGCTDPSACNFDVTAIIDNGSCCYDNCVTVDLIPVGGPVVFEIYTIGGALAGSFTVGGAASLPVGCTDVVSPLVDPCDFDALSVAYQNTVAFDTFCCNTSWDFLCQDTYVNLFGGQPDPACSAVSDNVACLPDGCYYVVASGVSWTLFGVNGGFAAGGDAAAEDFASFSVGSITCQIGCTEPVACNYDPTANVPDCTLCEFSSCLGCTYPDATNFTVGAGIDDGSCEFELSNDCPADLNQDGVINASDLSIFLSAFGTFCQ